MPGPTAYDDRRPQPKPELEESTRTLIERARAVRQNPVWDEEIRYPNFMSLKPGAPYNRIHTHTTHTHTLFTYLVWYLYFQTKIKNNDFF